MNDQQRPAWAIRLQAEREARGWSKAELGRRMLRATGSYMSLDSITKQIRDWERGRHFPRDWARTYATVFDIPKGELFPALAQGPATVPTGTVDQSPTLDQGDDDVKRRAALQLLAALGAGTAIPPGALETVLSGIEDAMGNPLDVDEWEATVHEYGQLIVRRPAGALVQDLTADIIAVGELLKRHGNTPDGPGLLRVSAGLSGLLAIDLGDAGDQRAARTAWNTARRAADASGDRDLRVWVRGHAAEHAVFTGRPGKAVIDLTGEAVQIADGAPSAGLARAHAARVALAAGQGDTVQAHASFGALKQTFGRLPGNAGGQTPFAYRETQLLWDECYMRALTGDGKAESTLARARALYPPDALAPITNLSLMRAALLIRSREIDTGLQHAIASLQHVKGRVMNAGARLITGKIIEALPDRARELPATRELRALTAGT